MVSTGGIYLHVHRLEDIVAGVHKTQTAHESFKTVPAGWKAKRRNLITLNTLKKDSFLINFDWNAVKTLSEHLKESTHQV